MGVQTDAERVAEPACGRDEAIGERCPDDLAPGKIPPGVYPNG